jgi:hypothetical protein
MVSPGMVAAESTVTAADEKEENQENHRRKTVAHPAGSKKQLGFPQPNRPKILIRFGGTIIENVQQGYGSRFPYRPCFVLDNGRHERERTRLSHH